MSGQDSTIPKKNIRHRRKPNANAVLRRAQKAVAVLACIQYTAEHEDLDDLDYSLADAISVALQLVKSVATGIDAVATANARVE